jgi:hypothetical protein
VNESGIMCIWVGGYMRSNETAEKVMSDIISCRNSSRNTYNVHMMSAQAITQ